MAEWRYVYVLYPDGSRVATVLKGARLLPALLYQLGNLGLTLELGEALPADKAHQYEVLHGDARARPAFGWYPHLDLPEGDDE